MAGPFPALHRRRRRRPCGEGAAIRRVGRPARHRCVPEKTRDHIHFARAAQEQRVLVSNDIDMKMLAETWFLEGRSYPGLVVASLHYNVMVPGTPWPPSRNSPLKTTPLPADPIVHIKPEALSRLQEAP